MEKINIFDYFFHCVKDFFKLTEQECDLMCEKGTDEELDSMIGAMVEDKKITEKTIEIIKKYIPNYNPEK